NENRMLPRRGTVRPSKRVVVYLEQPCRAKALARIVALCESIVDGVVTEDSSTTSDDVVDSAVVKDVVFDEDRFAGSKIGCISPRTVSVLGTVPAVVLDPNPVVDRRSELTIGDRYAKIKNIVIDDARGPVDVEMQIVEPVEVNMIDADLSCGASEI